MHGNQARTVSSRKSLALITGASVLAMAMANVAYAQDSDVEDEIVATGIRQSLENALQLERNADSLTEVILAEDIGKLPDQNLAEVLENITGVQITRTAGVGTNVQIRGTDANRVEINGVGTVPSGASRTGVSFEDVSAAIIAGVEVIKAPEAKTTEGSVGGTINLLTIRPLDLDETLLSFRLQGEESNLSTEGIQPRVSGAVGEKWTGSGGSEIGVVMSGSFARQEAVSFRPRADRDNINTIAGVPESPFLGIQFLVQEQENFDYETINFAGTIEAKPNENVKLYLDAIINEQERAQDSYRLQASGVSSFRGSSIPTSFETVDFGVGPGQVQAALTGTIERENDLQDNPNLRTSSDTGARVTDTSVLRLGAEWEKDKLFVRAQVANSISDTANPNLSTTLNFLNPNGGLRADVNGTRVNLPFNSDVAAALASVPFADRRSILNDNSTPFVYDLSNDSLAFGINFNSPYAPSQADLLNPANYVLDQVEVGNNRTENEELAVRFDVSYDLVDSPVASFLSSIDLGYRFNESTSEFTRINDRIGGFSRLADSPPASLFASLVVPGPDNYGDADGRNLFISDYLLLDPDQSFDDRQAVIDQLQAAVIQFDPGSPDVLNLQSDQNAFYDITETTNSFYAQGNFDFGAVRGNVGVRYVDTEISSLGFGAADANGVRQLSETEGAYDFILPRINLIAEPVEDLVLRASYGEDIRRPNFNNLGGFSFTQAENTAVTVGNPSLVPETVDSFDVSADWYFAPSGVISIGYFNKKRTNIFGNAFEGALLVPSTTTTGGLARETDPNCPGGGIFNPIVIPNVLGDPNTQGLCVDFNQPVNDTGTTTQEGIEMGIQYALADLEDSMGSLGFLSGFGFIANYTYQDFSGGDVIDSTSGRGLTVLGPVDIPRGLLDFSKNAYNLTAFYEKYGLSARVRYTWRDEFRTQDFGGGANTSGSSTFSFPVVTEARGQLNASVSYDVTDNFTVGVEGVNLTKSNIFQRAVSSTGPLAFAGYPDRRIIFGGSYRF